MNLLASGQGLNDRAASRLDLYVPPLGSRWRRRVNTTDQDFDTQLERLAVEGYGIVRREACEVI